MAPSHACARGPEPSDRVQGDKAVGDVSLAARAGVGIRLLFGGARRHTQQREYEQRADAVQHVKERKQQRPRVLRERVEALHAAVGEVHTSKAKRGL